MATFVPEGDEFLVNTTTTSNQSIPAVATLSGGGFVVTWSDFSRSGADTDAFAIRGQIFDAGGARSGDEFLVNTTTTGNQIGQSVAALSGDGFVVTWQDGSQSGGDTSGNAVRGQIFSSGGTKSGDEFLVNTTTASGQRFHSVAALSGDGFVVTWTDSSQSGGDTDSDAVRGQVFNADGTKSGGELLVNTTTTGRQSFPSVAALSGDGFVVTWTDESASVGDTDGGAVRGQIFNADGTKSGDEILVNTTTTGDQIGPSVAAVSGGFVVTWQDGSATGGDTDGNAVRGQFFNADGTKSGDEFLVNTATTSDQSGPSVAAVSGGFVVAWQDGSKTGGDTSSNAIRGQIFGVASAAPSGSGDGGGGGSSGGSVGSIIVTTSGGGTTVANNGGVAGSAAIVTDAARGAALSATVPAGHTVGAAGNSAAEASSTAATGFIAALQALNPAGLSPMSSASLGFFDDTGGSLFLYQRVSPVATGVTGDAFAFTGSTSDTGEAIIVDTSGLAAGNVVQVDDIEIVAVSGPGTLIGGGGSNRITASDDVQSLSAGLEADTVVAGGGGDTVYGNQGTDLLLGNGGADVIYAGQDIDTVYGGQDADVVLGNTAGDAVFGNLGDDLVHGGQGEDLVHGGQGSDTVMGGLGNDTIDGGLGDDLLSGGAGADVFLFATTDAGSDTILDFTPGEDVIQVSTGLNGLGLTAPGNLLARLSTDAAGDAVLDLGQGQTLTLAGIAPANLAADAFQIV